MRTLVKLVLSSIALVILLAGPALAEDYPPSQGAPSAPSAVSTSRGPGTTLPRTGSSSTVPVFWIGLAAVAFGSALVLGARRQRQVRSRHTQV